MFGKIVAISTVKPVSQNYASATGSARVVQLIHFWTDSKYPQTDTAVFHGDGYILQNAGLTKDLRTAFISVMMLALNTVVFKLILWILRYFHLTLLLYKSAFLTLLFHTIPTDIVSRHFQNDFFINSYRYHYQLIELQTITDVTDPCQAFFQENEMFLFQTTARIRENHTLLTKCQAGCSHKELSLIFTFILA